MQKGTLYLIPVSLGPSPSSLTTPADVATRARQLNYFVVENAKTARAELKRLEHPAQLRDLDIRELPEKPGTADLDGLLAPLLADQDAGLMSEAGCPAVADPGALLVRRAHEKGMLCLNLVNVPCGHAIDLLWKDIILSKDPNYGDWEYPGQAYRHLLGNTGTCKRKTGG